MTKEKWLLQKPFGHTYGTNTKGIPVMSTRKWLALVILGAHVLWCLIIVSRTPRHLELSWKEKQLLYSITLNENDFNETLPETTMEPEPEIELTPETTMEPEPELELSPEDMVRLCYLPISPARGDFHEFLLDISKDPRQPRPGRSIFFHETSCSKDHKIGLNARQSCAIESAAIMNPDRDIYVLFNSPRKMDNSSVFVNRLMDFKNIRLRNVDMWEYAKGTLVEDWTKENVLFTSDYLTAHMSDYMRFLSLYKYRGMHIDLDVVVKGNFDQEDSQCFAGAQDFEIVATGIISFDDSESGRRISELCLRDFEQQFNGQAWSHNGPYVITRVLDSICGTSNTTLMTAQRCQGFNVLPESKCYAINYPSWNLFFNPEDSEDVLKRLNVCSIAHVWNKYSITRNVTMGDGCAYDVLAKNYCPNVYSVCGEYF